MTTYATDERLHAGAARFRPPPLPRRPGRAERGSDRADPIPNLTARLLRIEEELAALNEPREKAPPREDAFAALAAPGPATHGTGHPARDAALRGALIVGSVVLSAVVALGAALWGPSLRTFQPRTVAAATSSAGATSLAPAPEPTHQVTLGETLGGIAACRLGDASRWREIANANREQLADPDVLDVGMVLRLPVE